MKRPNSFIVEAPKCGATSLISYLQFHPEVCVPEETGLYSFCEDFPAHRKITTLEDYIRRFPERNGDCRAYGRVLGLSSHGLPDCPARNVSKRHSSKLISTFTRRPPPLLLGAAGRLKKLLGIKRLRVIDFLNRLNVRKHRRDELPEAFRRELLAEFR